MVSRQRQPLLARAWSWIGHLSLAWQLFWFAFTWLASGAMLTLLGDWYVQQHMIARGFMAVGMVVMNVTAVAISGQAIARRWKDRNKLKVSIDYNYSVRSWDAEHMPAGTEQLMIEVVGLIVTNLSRTDAVSLEVSINLGDVVALALRDRLDIPAEGSAPQGFLVDAGAHAVADKKRVDQLPLSIVLKDHLTGRYFEEYLERVTVYNGG